MAGAVGGQPDVLSSVDMTAQRHSAADIERHLADADIQRHSAEADGPSLLLLQNAASPVSTINTVATVESVPQSPAALNVPESSHTATVTVDDSVLQQPVDPSMIPVRY